jgi:hypothetical protein
MNVYPCRDGRVDDPGKKTEHFVVVAHLIFRQWKHRLTTTSYITSINDTKITRPKNHFQVLSLLKSHQKSEK